MGCRLCNLLGGIWASEHLDSSSWVCFCVLPSSHPLSQQENHGVELQNILDWG